MLFPLPSVRTLSALRSTRLALLMSATPPPLALDEFCLKQFDDDKYTGTKIEYDKVAFTQNINELHAAGVPLTDGYAPFCKHLFVPNFTTAKLAYLKITPENEDKLRSGYDARTEQELPVLVRWFPSESAPEPPVSKFLDIILYSREQIRKETSAMGKEDDGEQAPWGIISVKAQDVDYELPMQPITMMRNALGKEEGGSGVPLGREAYQASVDFWEEHAPLK